LCLKYLRKYIVIGSPEYTSR